MHGLRESAIRPGDVVVVRYESPQLAHSLHSRGEVDVHAVRHFDVELTSALSKLDFGAAVYLVACTRTRRGNMTAQSRTHSRLYATLWERLSRVAR